MPRPPSFPLKVTHGAAVVTIYRQKAASTSGWQYVWFYGTAEGRKRAGSSTDPEEAVSKAKLKAQQLAVGLAESEHASRADLEQLAHARQLARKAGVPLISALEEYAKARTLAGGSIIPACREFAEQRRPEVKRVNLAAAIDAFIANKEKAGKEGERTYRAKLKTLLHATDPVDSTRLIIGDVPVDTISVAQFSAYLETFADGVTRNDHRKRAVTLFRWLLAQGYLPADRKLAIEATERASEEPTEIGIITPEVYTQVLEFIRAEHPEYLAAVVLAGFCGMRSDEIHGKRSKKGIARDTKVRQKWEDIWLDDRKALRVTVAKKNTPAWRNIPLADGTCDAAAAWLQLLPQAERVGYVCQAGAMERVRALCKAEGIDLPENCFRHSYITYTIAVFENKELAASRAGTSVQQIDKHYRQPALKATGLAWFAIRPKPDRR
jgi:hypothetical protein